MKKMGWKEGAGLGKRAQGRTANVQVTVKNNMRGVGCSLKHNSQWVAGQDDFNAVLRMLNDDDTSAFKQDKLKQKRAIKRKAMHSKFVKAKDLSTSSKSDMKALFGSAGDDIFSQLKAQTQPKKEESSDSDSGSENEEKAPDGPKMNVETAVMSNTTTSTVSCNDYFAKKLAMMQAKGRLSSIVKTEVKEEDLRTAVNEAEDAKVQKRLKKRQKKDKVKTEAPSSDERPTTEAEPQEAPIKKRKKKRKHESTEESAQPSIKQEEIEEPSSPEPVKKKKKKKKSKSATPEVQPETPDSIETSLETPKKKKKKKKSTKTE